MFRKNGIRGVFILTVVIMMMMALTPMAGANGALVTNGDFENDNVGVDSDYTYVTATGHNTLEPPYMYAIGASPYDYHASWGDFVDHSGFGDMMIVNGSSQGAPGALVWGQNVTLAPYPYEPMSAPLYAGQHILVGTINVSYDGINLTIEYVIDDPWMMQESHLHVAATEAEIPQKNENPIPGQFDYSDYYDPLASGDTFVVPWTPADGPTPVIAAHATVLEMDYDGLFWATEPVVDYHLGYRTAVDNPFRVVPESALGSPNGTFYSLGLTGEFLYTGDFPPIIAEPTEPQMFYGDITVAFDGWVFNGEGYDISVHEVTGGRSTYPEETAAVWGFYDGHWYLLGDVSNWDLGYAPTGRDGIGLIDLGDLPYVEMVKIVDTTPVENYTGHTTRFDGYDLDAVDARVLYYGEESAWGGEEDFSGKNWATYLTYEIDNLCDGNYHFEMWGASSHHVEPAQLEIEFNDVVVANLDLSTTVGEWLNTTANWPSEGVCDVYIEIRDYTNIYSGDDFVIDDISLTPVP